MSRSPFVAKGLEYIKKLDRYEQLQLDYSNYERQLAGRPPLEKQKKNAKGRNTRKSRGRSRSTRPGNPNTRQKNQDKSKEVKSITIVEVSHEDSLKYYASMDENRYALAEYLLFEFSRVDTCLDLLRTLESSSQDSSIRHQAAYMQYYALETVRGDSSAAREILKHIQDQYPAYYEVIMHRGQEDQAGEDSDSQRLNAARALFDEGRWSAAAAAYRHLKADSTLSLATRATAGFNQAWLNDQFLLQKDGAVAAYQYVVDHFGDHPLAAEARQRLRLIQGQATSSAVSQRETSSQDGRETVSGEKASTPAKEQGS
jgi:hypothetical protein